MKGVAGENCCNCWNAVLTTWCTAWASPPSCGGAAACPPRAFVVNGKKVNVPSFLCSANDNVAVKEKSRKVTRILENLELSSGGAYPSGCN